MSEQQTNQPNTSVGTSVMQEPDSTSIDLVELLYRMLASWKLIVGLALLFALVAGIYTSYFVTPLYKATSTIYVLSRRDSAINMSDLQIGTALTSDYIKVFDMWEVHEEVISNLDLPYSYSQMRGMLSVVNTADTRMLDISVTSDDPEEAAMIANEYARVASQYIADTMSTDKPNVMSVALVPSNPVSPSKTRNIMMGFILGGVLGAGIVTVRMLMDDKFKTADEIRRYTGLATLAVVPIEEGMVRENRKSKSRRKRR
jgi:capsular polysaccharide biosynthesis protein